MSLTNITSATKEESDVEQILIGPCPVVVSHVEQAVTDSLATRAPSANEEMQEEEIFNYYSLAGC